MNALPLRILGTGRQLPAESVDSQTLDARWALAPGTTLRHLGVARRYYAGAGE
ncbi:ketoacyl-ACP synthase III, partial [Xanthomonas sp. Kuri4-2]